MEFKEISKNNRVGMRGEQLARRLYVKRGFQIVAQNFFNRRGKQVGEIDFIAVSRKSLVFVEVKTRTTGALWSATEAVSWRKQCRLRSSVRWFMALHPQFSHLRPRIDVIAILLGLDNAIKNVIIIPNAVEGGV